MAIQNITPLPKEYGRKPKRIVSMGMSACDVKYEYEKESYDQWGHRKKRIKRIVNVVV